MKKLLFTTDGRITRSEYWKAMLIFLGAGILNGVVYYLLWMVIPGSVSEDGNYSVTGVRAIPYLALGFGSFVFSVWAGICVNAKRCHDRNKSGWFMLVSLIPIIGVLWYAIEIPFLRGTRGPNRFGADPRDSVLAIA